VHLDQKQPGYDGTSLARFLEESGVAYEILAEDTYSVVTSHLDEKATYCSLCSRLRRGILYTAAEKLDCNKVALGHHKDDIIETLFINMCYAGEISTMVPAQSFFKGRFTVIRPLAFTDEQTIRRFAAEQGFPQFVNPCPTSGTSKRQEIKALLRQLYRANRKIKGNLFRSMSRVRTDYLLK
jgi:tRNA 2-thiocytidine biosynthesis protein TtcA